MKFKLIDTCNIKRQEHLNVLVFLYYKYQLDNRRN